MPWPRPVSLSRLQALAESVRVAICIAVVYLDFLLKNDLEGVRTDYAALLRKQAGDWRGILHTYQPSSINTSFQSAVPSARGGCRRRYSGHTSVLSAPGRDRPGIRYGWKSWDGSPGGRRGRPDGETRRYGTEVGVCHLYPTPQRHALQLAARQISFKRTFEMVWSPVTSFQL